MIAGLFAFVYSLFLGELPLIAVVATMTTFVILRHRANLKRIREKTEPKVKWKWILTR